MLRTAFEDKDYAKAEELLITMQQEIYNEGLEDGIQTVLDNPDCYFDDLNEIAREARE